MKENERKKEEERIRSGKNGGKQGRERRERKNRRGKNMKVT